MFPLVRHAFRAVSVFRTFSRNGALFPLAGLGVPDWLVGIASVLLIARPRRATRNRAQGERLVAAMEALGPAFVKIGQAFSVRPDLVGQRIASDLSVLRDRMSPFEGLLAVETIEAEFGCGLDDLFASFDHEAFAAASIAQVHRATTLDGTPVAVKVLRPGIEEAFARDMKLAVWVAGAVERWLPELRRLRPRESTETMTRAAGLEMDLRLEAAAADELRENFSDDTFFAVPAVDWRRTGRRVLTLRWVDAVPIDQLSDGSFIDAPLEDVVANLARIFFLQVFRDGFFHADMHPGNLFVDSQGTVHAIDFGIMGRLDRPTRHYLAEMLQGFLTGDYRRVARAHRNAGYVPPHFSEEEFAQAARSIAEPIFGLPLREISLAHLLSQLFAIADKFEMQAQPQLLMLQKTMLVAEGVGRSLHPETNIWELAKPLIDDWMSRSSEPESRAREVTGHVLDALQQLRDQIVFSGEAARLLPLAQRTAAPPRGDASESGSNGRVWQILTVCLLLFVVVAMMLD